MQLGASAVEAVPSDCGSAYRGSNPPFFRRAEWSIRKRFTVLFSPGAVSGNCLQWWPAPGSASAWPFHLGLGHAGAGLCFQASTDVYDGSLLLCLVLSIVRRILSFVLRPTVRGHEGQQTYQSKKPHSGFQSICHTLILLADVHSELFDEPISGNFGLT
jgi:hypothetical protein